MYDTGTLKSISAKVERFSTIGEGSSSVVSKVMYKKKLAVMKMRKSGDVMTLGNEVEMMAKAAGAGGVPQIMAAAMDRAAGGTRALVMSYLPYSSVAGAMEKQQIISQRQALKIMTSAAKSLQELHEAGVVHCEVKSDNILVDLESSNTYLIDLGYSALINQKCPHFMKRRIETHHRFPFYDPVIYVGGVATPSTDVYSLGFMFRELIEGLAGNGVVTDTILPAVLDLSKSMTEFESEKRPSMVDVISTLESLADTLPFVYEKVKKNFHKKGSKNTKVEAEPKVKNLSKKEKNALEKKGSKGRKV